VRDLVGGGRNLRADDVEHGAGEYRSRNPEARMVLATDETRMGKTFYPQMAQIFADLIFIGVNPRNLRMIFLSVFHLCASVAKKKSKFVFAFGEK
jgi:hypothetical protein